jgi:CubicO group peptidase (beta-lactamase class C family)
MRLLLVILVPIAMASCAGKQSTGPQRAAALADSLMTAKQIPGMAISVMRNNKFVWSRGFGHADLEQDVHVDPGTTKFRIGSISKSITSVGLALLVQDGRVNLDSSIYYYLPDFPKKKYRPTIRQIASHTGGIRHYKGEEFLLNKRFASVEDGLTIFKEDTLMFKPGTDYQYSSYGYNLISAVMEKSAGETFLVFMQKQVIEPLQLHSTIPDYYDSLIPSRSRYYERSGSGWINSPSVDNSYKWAGGGYLSTAEDLARFGQAIIDRRLITEATLKEFVQPQKLESGEVTSYGLGWSLRTDSRGRATFGHTGGSVGGSSHLLIYPEEKVIVSVVTNLSSAGLGDLAFRIAGAFLTEKE